MRRAAIPGITHIGGKGLTLSRVLRRGYEKEEQEEHVGRREQGPKAVCNDIGPLLLTASCASVWRVPKLPALCLTANIAEWSNCTDYRSRFAPGALACGLAVVPSSHPRTCCFLAGDSWGLYATWGLLG